MSSAEPQYDPFDAPVDAELHAVLVTNGWERNRGEDGCDVYVWPPSTPLLEKVPPECSWTPTMIVVADTLPPQLGEWVLAPVVDPEYRVIEASVSGGHEEIDVAAYEAIARTELMEDLSSIEGYRFDLQRNEDVEAENSFYRWETERWSAVN
jgi:hypothetical protein